MVSMYDSVAYLSVEENHEFIYLNWLVVSEELRSQGLGSRIMRDLIQHAESVGKPICLFPLNYKAACFYEALGFRFYFLEVTDYMAYDKHLTHMTYEKIEAILVSNLDYEG